MVFNSALKGLTCVFLRRGVVSTSPNSQAGGPPLVGCPRLLIQFIHSYPTYRRPSLHPQPENAPCRGDRDPHGEKFLTTWIAVGYSRTFPLVLLVISWHNWH